MSLHGFNGEDTDGTFTITPVFTLEEGIVVVASGGSGGNGRPGKSAPSRREQGILLVACGVVSIRVNGRREAANVCDADKRLVVALQALNEGAGLEATCGRVRSEPHVEALDGG